MKGRALPVIPRAPKSQTGNSLRKEPQWSLPAPAPPIPPWRSRLQAVGKCPPPLKKWNEVLWRSLTLYDTPAFYLHLLYFFGFQTTFSSVGLLAQCVSST